MNWTVSSGVVGNVVRGVGVWYKVSIRLETFHQVSAMTTPATTRVGLCPPLLYKLAERKTRGTNWGNKIVLIRIIRFYFV